MITKDIQQALFDRGYNPGPIDGFPGRLTTKAIKQFQQENGLTADGLVGPKTLAKLFPQDSTSDKDEECLPLSLPWLEIAMNLLDVKEVAGKGSNPLIIDWAAKLGLADYNDDDIPWCGLFVAHCISTQLSNEAIPNNPLLARNWQKFGARTTPGLGAVLIFWRETKQSYKGHVGLYWAEDDDAYHVLGGNQANAVTITRIARNRLLEARWPVTGLAGKPIIRKATSQGYLLSTNEA
ncbi:NlpC/P60 family protein [Alteromonas sp. ASW11-130]|uniref:NlpC/P60 family protein n=1 Tax=Alteromonas sp. ASW11-130 TaxID=3015775 RepID=UPI0022418789|nr:TIGR02594 family protein [Alteromonas sp. ASW11-130]MCW8093404.1 peptidoglycan-binding protein [Alteromonas sp. ASW11-130]